MSAFIHINTNIYWGPCYGPGPGNTAVDSWVEQKYLKSWCKDDNHNLTSAHCLLAFVLGASLSWVWRSWLLSFHELCEFGASHIISKSRVFIYKNAHSHHITYLAIELLRKENEIGKCGTMVNSMGAGARLPAFRDWLCYFLAIWPWANYLASLGLGLVR